MTEPDHHPLITDDVVEAALEAMLPGVVTTVEDRMVVRAGLREALAKIEGEKPCERCKGKGQVWFADPSCPVCGGKGKVPADPLVRLSEVAETLDDDAMLRGLALLRERVRYKGPKVLGRPKEFRAALLAALREEPEDA